MTGIVIVMRVRSETENILQHDDLPESSPSDEKLNRYD